MNHLTESTTRTVPADRVAALRAFNRFWTKETGALAPRLLESPYSLTEARTLFELAQHEETEVADLRRSLEIDAGYLSRIVARFRARGLVETGPSDADGRRQVVRLTPAGREAYEELDARSAAQAAAILEPLPEEAQQRLVTSMETIARLLGAPRSGGSYVLRPPRPGDLGWVVQRHGAVYAAEHAFDETFEAAVARIVADYVDRRDPVREQGWIAEVDGRPAGSVFCMRKTSRVAQLRLLLVEPEARGLGIGTRLVDECVRFARRNGYRRMTLWTTDILRDARRLYERAGFEVVEAQPQAIFGRDVVAETWELDLDA
jgi:DNA-binding MarR family transcriptional regulator/GNAT superfamily N-acetyltransferase